MTRIVHSYWISGSSTSHCLTLYGLIRLLGVKNEDGIIVLMAEHQEPVTSNYVTRLIVEVVSDSCYPTEEAKFLGLISVERQVKAVYVRLE